MESVEKFPKGFERILSLLLYPKVQSLGNAGGDPVVGFLASVPRSQPLEEQEDYDDGQRSANGRPEHRVGSHGDDRDQAPAENRGQNESS
jgi:hypothetical protein